MGAGDAPPEEAVLRILEGVMLSLPLVAAIVPVVELPNLNLAGPPSVADIVASRPMARPVRSYLQYRQVV